MLVHATKDHAEREDDESERLVREAPKLKPPRRDKRREGIRPDSDPDVDGDPDLSSKDKSLNFKQVGGSVLRVLLRYASAQDKIPVKKKDTGQTVFVSPDTLKEKPGEYEEFKEEDESLQLDEGSPQQSEPEGSEPSSKKEPSSTKKRQPSEEELSEEESSEEESSEEEPSSTKKRQPSEEESSEEESREEGKGEKPKKSKPSLAEQHGIAPPQRREASMAERVEANYALAQSLPPDVAAKLIAARIHPDDAKQVVESYQAAQARRIDGDVVAFASKLRDFYETDPDKIPPPAKWKTADGKRVDFETLPPDEQANAYRQHQMQVLAVSLASKDAILKKLAGDRGDVDPAFAEALTDSLLGRAKVDPQRVFEAATKGATPPISKTTAKRLLSAVQNDPATKDVVRKYLEASDYREAKLKFLGDRGFSERDSPAAIVGGLMDSRKFFSSKAQGYGLEGEDNTGAKHFEAQVLSKLKALDPAKHQQVHDTLIAVAAADYDRAKKAYDREYQRWSRTQKGEAPKEPVKPFGYGTTQGRQSLQREGQNLWEDLVGRSGSKKQAASVALQHFISSYLLDSSMAPRSSQTENSSFRSYLGLSKAAKDTSRSELEKAIYAKFPADSKRKKGSDLVVMLDEDLASRLHKEAFSTLTLQDLSDSALQMLAGALKVKTAGYAYTSETMDLLFYGKGVFNREVIHDLYSMPFTFRDAQGEVHDDVGMKVTGITYGPLVTRIDEEKGFTREILVNVSIPKGSKADAFKAAKTVATRHKLQVELAKPGVKPVMRQSEKAKVRKMPGLRGLRASSFAIAEGATPSATVDSGPRNGETTMTTLSQKKAAQADNILGRLDRIAQVVQDSATSWGMPFEEAKALVNTIDKLADDTETFLFGDDSLRVRQAELLLQDDTFVRAARVELGDRVIAKAAAVLQRDPDEAYMDTFNSPMKPIQTDADEPYMSAYEDDQTVALAEGEDATGRQLAPGA